MVEATPNLAEHVGRGHPDLVEEQLRGVLGLQAHLVQVPAAGEAGHAALHHQQAEGPVPAGRAGAGPGHHEDQVGVDPGGDEGLGPGQHPRVAVRLGPGPDPGQVAARARLAHGDRADQLARGEAGQPPLLLLLRAQRRQVRGHDVAVQRESRGAGPRLGQFLGHHRVEPEVIDSPAAELLGDVEADDPVLARRLVHVPVNDPGLLPGLRVRCDLPGQELPYHFAELLVFRLVHGTPHALLPWGRLLLG